MKLEAASNEGTTMQTIKRNALLWIAGLLMLAGVWQIAQGAYIHAKAQYAQYLLRKSWDKTLAGAKEVKPWPWADTWPVARLQVLRLGIDQFVLAGASGRTLAFGPGHLSGSPLPGEQGNTVFSGHRDTHFKFMQHLRLGDEIVITAASGMQYHYEISDTTVVNYQDTRVTMSSDERLLTLVTCYPFRSINPSGDKRYVVIANYLPPRETNRVLRRRMLATN
jgi:sortase A